MYGNNPHPAIVIDPKFRVRTERCESCLYRAKYPRQTRERILADVAERDGFVQCHNHDQSKHVCCNGYFLAAGERGGTPVQLAIRLTEAGMTAIEWVTPEMYLVSGDEEEE